MRQVLCLLAAIVFLTGCSGEDENVGKAPPRGLKTILVAENESSTLRRYPSVLQPSELSTVAFKLAGRLDKIDLQVGQIVKKGDILAQLDSRAAEIQIESAIAVVAQARVSAENSAAHLERQETLLERGVVTQVVVDNAKTDATTTAQALVKAESALDNTKVSANDTSLFAPFDGVISSVDAQTFATVSAGAPIATLYRADGFEVNFTVNYDTINRLVVGKVATLRLADAPDRTLSGVVTELGASADAVASFPVVVSVKNAHEDIKSGMAVEVNLEFDLPVAAGFTIPISAAVIEGKISGARDPNIPSKVKLFVYDPDSKTVKKREVTIAGIRENSVLVISGLKAGERVASAGVSFLTDGQSVILLED